MIRSESEYQNAVSRLDAERERFAQHKEAWKGRGFTPPQIAKLAEPLESFHMQLEEEVRSYERLKRGQFEELENLDGLGQTLIGLRIARGMTQRERRWSRAMSATSIMASPWSGPSECSTRLACAS